MNNETKYNLIVELKKLIIETDIKEEKLLYSPIINLYASKVMQFVYSDKELTNFFEDKVNTYKNLKSDKENYIKALELRNKQLTTLINKKLCLNYEPYYLSKGSYDEFTPNDHIFDVYDFKLDTEWVTGIFRFIEPLFEPLTCDKVIDEETGDYLCNLFLTIGGNDYRINLSETYDYYYLLNYEKKKNIYYNHKSSNLFVFVAYKKILSDLLYFLNTIDLSEEEKREFEKKKKLDDARNKLKKYPEKLMIFNEICADRNITAETIAKNISKIRNKKMRKSTVYNHIRNNGNQKGIVMILTGKDGTIIDLREYIDTLI